MIFDLELIGLAMWAILGGVIASELDDPWYQRVGLIVVWPFIAAYVFIYHLVAVWPRRFY